MLFQNVTNGICHENLDWIENTPEATTLDFISKKQEFEEALAPIWEKINEPCEFYELLQCTVQEWFIVLFT